MWPTNSDSLPRDKFHALCASRIVQRGDRHQSLRAGEQDDEQIIWQFLGQHERFDPEVNAADGKFDHVVEMHAEWTQEEALQRCLEALAGIEDVLPAETSLPLAPERVNQAIEYASTWTPSVRKESTAPPRPRTKAAAPARYYGIAVETDLQTIAEKHLPVEVRDDPESLWSTLVKSSRVERHPHVTLVHRNELEHPDEAIRAEKQAHWDRYAQLVEGAAGAAARTGGGADEEATRALEVELTLGPRLAWDGRAMSIEVSALAPQVDPHTSGPTPSIIMAEDRAAHITIGTRASDIRPVEGRWLMEAVMEGKQATEAGGEIRVVEIEPVRVRGRLAGLS